MKTNPVAIQTPFSKDVAVARLKKIVRSGEILKRGKGKLKSKKKRKG